MLDKTILKFFMTGILNTGVGYAMLLGLIALNVHYALAGMISTILGVAFNFKSYGYIVFKNSSNKLILKFLAGYCFTYTLFITVVYLGNHFLGIQLYLAVLSAMILCSVVSYYINLIYVYRVQKD